MPILDTPKDQGSAKQNIQVSSIDSPQLKHENQEDEIGDSEANKNTEEVKATGIQHSSNTNMEASNNNVQEQASPATLDRSDEISPQVIRRMESKKNIEALTKEAKKKLEIEKKIKPQPTNPPHLYYILFGVKELCYKNRVVFVTICFTSMINYLIFFTL